VTDLTTLQCAGNCVRIAPCGSIPEFDHMCVFTARIDVGSMLRSGRRLEERVIYKVESIVGIRP
jgi:hypothetical protein